MTPAIVGDATVFTGGAISWDWEEKMVSSGYLDGGARGAAGLGPVAQGSKPRAGSEHPAEWRSNVRVGHGGESSVSRVEGGIETKGRRSLTKFGS